MRVAKQQLMMARPRPSNCQRTIAFPQAMANLRKLAHARTPVCPVVVCENGERGVNRARGEGKRLGNGAQGGGGAGWPLGEHDRGGFGADDGTVAGLVRADAGADVEDAAGVAQGLTDGLGDAWVGRRQRA